MKIETLSAADTAYYLRAKLGAVRSWSDFLADCIRGRQSVSGYQLMPVARHSDGRALRPVYALSAVEDFVAKVLAATPTTGAAKIKPTMLDIDAGKSWRLNQFARDGSPIAPRRTAGAGCDVSH